MLVIACLQCRAFNTTVDYPLFTVQSVGVVVRWSGVGEKYSKNMSEGATTCSECKQLPKRSKPASWKSENLKIFRFQQYDPSVDSRISTIQYGRLHIIHLARKQSAQGASGLNLGSPDNL